MVLIESWFKAVQFSRIDDTKGLLKRGIKVDRMSTTETSGKKVTAHICAVLLGGWNEIMKILLKRKARRRWTRQWTMEVLLSMLPLRRATLGCVVVSRGRQGGG